MTGAARSAWRLVRLAIATAAVALGALGGLAPSVSAQPAAVTPPVVVELFTSQGCSACLEANARVGALAERDGALVLSWSVDYWDFLGWRDTLARPEFTARQRAYTTRLSLRRLYTPQVVVGGRHAAPGFEHERIEALVDRPGGPQVDMRLAEDGSRVWVGSGGAPAGGGEVWLIRYDARPRAVAVRQGENRGREVTVTNAVRTLERLGAWRGRPVRLRLPAATEPGLRTAVLLQGVDGGPILGVVAD